MTPHPIRFRVLPRRATPSVLRDPEFAVVGELRPVGVLAAVHGHLQEIKASGPHNETGAEAVTLLIHLLEQNGEGRYRVIAKPDKTERISKAPDYIITRDDGSRELVVEATQVLVFGTERQQQLMFVDLIGSVTTQLNGSLMGSVRLVSPFRPDLPKRDRSTIFRELADDLLTADRELRAISDRQIRHGFYALKEHESGAGFAFDVLKPVDNPVLPIGPISDLFLPVLDEAQAKFRAYPLMERVLVVQFHADVADVVAFKAEIVALRSRYPDIDRFYLYRDRNQPMVRAW